MTQPLLTVGGAAAEEQQRGSGHAEDQQQGATCTPLHDRVQVGPA